MPKQTITSFNVKTQGPLIWNKCAHEIKDSKSLYTLKAKLNLLVWVFFGGGGGDNKPLWFQVPVKCTV